MQGTAVTRAPARSQTGQQFDLRENDVVLVTLTPQH
jgi:hypothetical protein